MSKDKYNVTNFAHTIDTSCDLKVRMLETRDGVKLHTMIYFPADSGDAPLPVLLIRTAYHQPVNLLLPDKRMAENNLVYIVQCCRGTGFSEGEFDPAKTEQEKNDVEDLFCWLKKQPWFNGRCVMFGGSYTGWMQWCAARTGFDGLVGIAPWVAPVYACIGSAIKGGGLRHDLVINWVLNLYHRRKYGFQNMPDYESMGVLKHLPLSDCDRAAGYDRVEAFQRMISNVDSPGKILSHPLEYFPKLKVPAFIAGGWFDPFKDETITTFQLMKKVAATEKARKITRLWLGPWEHAGLINHDLFGEAGKQDEELAAENRFLMGLLNDPESDPIPEIPVVRYFMIGENRWHDADDWPPPESRLRKIFLHSSGTANSSGGDGVLSETAPAKEMPDSYISDPANPAVSCGGKCTALGCYDRSEDEKRSDMLVYTTGVMEKALTIAGNIKFHFHASASTPDTDFCAILTMVTPEGNSLFLTAGMIRARFCNDLENGELLTPGKIYEFTIDLSDIAVKINPGHALRLEICGQYYPLWHINPNTGNPLKDDDKMQISRHTIFHDETHPAYLTLPVLEEA